REPTATFDRRRVQRSSPEQSVCFLRKDIVLQPVELCEDEPGVTNGIDTDVIAASVRGPSREFDFEPDESPMSRTNCESRRLSENRCICLHSTCDERSHAEARVFLVRYGGNDYLSRRRAAQHVGR